MVELRPRQKGSDAPSFAGIVGQQALKTGLLAVAADDDLDGLLVRGEKGTAKSTAVRALADLLPEQRAVADCPYGCPPDDPSRQCSECREQANPPVETRPVPLVTLPLGATRDRVVGTLSVADAMDGDASFDPGLLARANRGILYVDEVNLLDDHLVDVLLDAAAGGWNRVERDGVSVAHPAQITLVGTMNPEEGDLRPQLRDRFAIQATVTACEDLSERVTIIERAVTGNAESGDDAAADSEVRARLRDARDRLADGVALPDEFAERAAAVCRDAGVDGHRGDIAVARTARALAALDGRSTVLESDVERGAEFALPHRLQSRPFEEEADLDDVLADHFEDESVEEREDTETGHSGANEDGGSDPDAQESTDEDDAGGDGAAGTDAEPERGAENREQRRAGEGDDERSAGDRGADADGSDPPPTNGDEPRPADADQGDRGGQRSPEPDGETQDDREDGESGETATPVVPGQSRAAVGDATAPDLDVTAPDGDGTGSRRSQTPSTNGSGTRVRTRRAESGDPIDAAASVRAAARNGHADVGQRDLRASVRAGDGSALVVFAVDASASMRPAMETTKGVVLELLRDAYQHRDEVAFVAFAGEDADVLLPPTDSVARAARHLKELPTGDRTPLPAGLATTAAVLERADPAAGLAVVVSDGRANVADGGPTAATRECARELAAVAEDVLVVDAGEREDRAGLLDLLASTADAETVPLSDLRAGTVDAAVGGPDD